MQVAKYWRNNQLRYRLQGVVQQKIDITIPAIHPAQVSIKQDHQIVLSDKVKIA